MQLLFQDNVFLEAEMITVHNHILFPVKSKSEKQKKINS
jgi:hypothetical protein